MTVEVIRTPRLNLRTTCNHCRSRLSYTFQDILTRHGTDIGGGPDGCEYIICPECKNEVILKSW